MDDLKALEAAFTRELIDYDKEEYRCIGYNPSYFVRMVNEIGGVETARRLVRKQELSDGFVTLWQVGRLDLTLEAFMLQPRWRPLFSDEELQLARQRLKSVGYVASQDKG